MSVRLRTLSIFVFGAMSGLCLSFGYTAWAARDMRPTAVVGWQDAQFFAEIFEHIKTEYVDQISDRQLMESAVRGAVSGLDPYSAYLDPKEFEELRMNTTGEYSGVGIEISTSGGVLKVVTAIDDSPAARAGIRSGDVVIAIDKIPVDADNVNEAVDRLRGKSGSHVRLTIARDSVAQPFEIALTRGAVLVHSVKQEMLEPGYGYIRISQFNENTGVDFARAIKALQAQTSLHGLVLDLRNNPGGVLDAAVSVADALLDRGIIVTADGRSPEAKFSMEAHEGDLMNSAPVAVLVNAGSASASEIVAGALQDNKRAKLIGQTTYGKGLVQSVLPLSGGGALKLTTSRYHTPSGASINEHGIVPDVILDAVQTAMPNSVDAQARAALENVKRRS